MQKDLSLRSLRTALALRLALAIPLLQASHARLADLRIPGVESFELVCGDDCGEFDSGSLRGLGLDDFAIFHGTWGACVSIGGTD